VTCYVTTSVMGKLHQLDALIKCLLPVCLDTPDAERPAIADNICDTFTYLDTIPYHRVVDRETKIHHTPASCEK